MPILHLANIHTKSELMDTLGIFFSFPHWWGHNWDALNDCIKDGELSTLPSQFHII